MKKISPIEKKYNAQIKRIKNAIHKIRKKGFNISEDRIIPDRPSKITKASLTKLEKITPSTIYKKSSYTFTEDAVTKISPNKAKSKTNKVRKGITISGSEAVKILNIKTRGSKKGNIFQQARKEKEREEYSKLSKEYWKQYSRIKSLISRLVGRGYIVKFDIPKRSGDKITIEDVEELQKITADYVYSNSYYLNEKGEKIPGLERRKQERKEAARKAQETRKRKKDTKPEEPAREEPPHVNGIIIEWIREQIRSWTPDHRWSNSFYIWKEGHKNLLESYLENGIAMDGEDAVEKRLESQANLVNDCVVEILYDSDQSEVNSDLMTFASILKGEKLTADEAREMSYTIEEQYLFDTAYHDKIIEEEKQLWSGV